MTCQFRYVIEPDPRAVSVRLYIDIDGSKKAEISGPLGYRDGATDRCIVDCATALMAAIRIANCKDVEVVILGNLGLWDSAWGTLMVRGEPILAKVDAPLTGS